VSGPLTVNAGLPCTSNNKAAPAPVLANTSPGVRVRLTETSLGWPGTEDTVTVPNGPQPVRQRLALQPR
jgi:hypothetical protein